MAKNEFCNYHAISNIRESHQKISNQGDISK